MAARKNVNPALQDNKDTGFGTNPGTLGGRFINKDGSFNLVREGVPLLRRVGLYQRMLSLSRWKFILVILLFYFFINLVYTCLYLLIGSSQLQGIVPGDGFHRFREVFYFSTETFTTVGYGRVNPMGDAANIVASLEALSGFLSFAIATGLIYGRFAKPQAYLQFSHLALVSPYKDKTALMFRFANYKNHHTLTNAEIKVSLAMMVEEQGKMSYRFYDLALERYKVDNLVMNWTVVHAIDENSPLNGLTAEDMAQADVELYVLITGFDDVYSSPVLQRTSYTYREMRFDAKFMPMYRESADGSTTILEMHKIDDIKYVKHNEGTAAGGK